mmetsp:Transcript_1059/g.1996  ORF Transcript_1059/g.1996 Transcript_1059/m.1996 type:complete len:210 (+) Transcript_1059:166-795(+)
MLDRAAVISHHFLHEKTQLKTLSIFHASFVQLSIPSSPFQSPRPRETRAESFLLSISPSVLLLAATNSQQELLHSTVFLHESKYTNRCVNFFHELSESSNHNEMLRTLLQSQAHSLYFQGTILLEPVNDRRHPTGLENCFLVIHIQSPKSDKGQRYTAIENVPNHPSNLSKRHEIHQELHYIRLHQSNLLDSKRTSILDHNSTAHEAFL